MKIAKSYIPYGGLFGESRGGEAQRYKYNTARPPGTLSERSGKEGTGPHVWHRPAGLRCPLDGRCHSASGEKLCARYYIAVPNVTRTFGVKPEGYPQSQVMCAYQYDYLLGGSLIIKNGTIERVLFDGGFAAATRLSNTTYGFDMYYYNKDHLGNNREVVAANGNVRQVTNYYPFGAPYADPAAVTGSTLQPFKYNGKELDTMHGLNTYDYGARQYYSIVGRWDRIDPLCEKYYSVSPYVYCEDDPVNAIDPDGRVGLKVIAKGLYKVGKTVAKKGLSSLSKGTTYATAFNDVVEDVKTVFDSKASTGDRFVAGFSLLSEVISPVSYKDAKTIGNAANGISRRILPNGGNAKPHGGKKHNDAIDEYKKKLKESGGNSNIRKNQKQVDASGNTVGNNRPDIQYDDENSVHHNIEFDSSAKHSARHKRTIESNDGQSDNIFIILNRNHDK